MGALQTDPGAGLHQEPLEDFILVRTDEVDEGERLRPVDPVWAQALGQMMARVGQDTPIQVCRLPGRNRWTLVAGAHRLAGAAFVGIDHLRAEVVSADRDARRLREVRENLWRSDLTPIDRATFIAEAVAIHKRRAGIDPSASGGSIAAQVRWQKAVATEATDATATIAIAYGWGDKVGEQIGLSARTVRDDLMLYRRLAPSTVERLRLVRHPILSNASQLRALAKLEPAEQDTVSFQLATSTRNGRPITLAQARALVAGAERPLIRPEDKRRNTVFSTIQRMSTREVRGLFGDKTFHRLLPGNVQRLLAPLLGEFEESHDDDLPADQGGEAARLAGHGSADGADRADPLSGDLDGGSHGEGQSGNDMALVGGSPVLGVDADRLTAAIGFIAEQLGKDMDADWIVGELTRRYEARSRYANNTYELKLGKVMVTCTAGGANLLGAWMRKAQRIITVGGVA